MDFDQQDRLVDFWPTCAKERTGATIKKATKIIL